MAKKEKPKCYPVTCDKCGATAVGIPGRPHRRCNGGQGQPPREKRARRMARQERGKWR